MSDPLKSDYVHAWLTEPLPKDVAGSINRLAHADDMQHVAIMPDVHLANDVCIGVAAATTELIYPQVVGGDIGCGMAAIATDADADLLSSDKNAARLLSSLYEQLPTNRHSTATACASLPRELADSPLSDPRLEKQKLRNGRVQLGTLGRGNHFLEFQADEEARLWIMVHSGSRGMGQLIARHHFENCTADKNGLLYLPCDSEKGMAYLNDMQWARQYASQNRLQMIRAVESLMCKDFAVKIDWSTLIHSDHNHVQRESHFGKSLWVHRKGAQSARGDEFGIIPGSMGTTSYHVAGRGDTNSLHSCSHGAGRRQSRSHARRLTSERSLKQQMRSVWFDERISGVLREEVPSAYKDIRLVMRSQRELTRIVRELRPLLSYKGK